MELGLGWGTSDASRAMKSSGSKSHASFHLGTASAAIWISANKLG